MTILRSFTPLVEPIALDEAFLDVAGVAPRPRHRARDRTVAIRARVQAETGLTVSVGVATTKLLAKLASDLAKPDGLLVVEPGTELDVPAPARRCGASGVSGPATERRLAALGVETVGDLAALPEDTLVRALGNAAGSPPPRARLEPRRAAGRRRPGGEVDRARGDLPDRPPRPRRARAPARRPGRRRGVAPAGRARRRRGPCSSRCASATSAPSPAPARCASPTDLAADVGRVARELLRSLDVGRRRAPARHLRAAARAPGPGPPSGHGPAASGSRAARTRARSSRSRPRRRRARGTATPRPGAAPGRAGAFGRRGPGPVRSWCRRAGTGE